MNKVICPNLAEHIKSDNFSDNKMYEMSKFTLVFEIYPKNPILKKSTIIPKAGHDHNQQTTFNRIG